METACPLCSSAKPKNLVQSWPDYNYYLCGDCEIIFSRPFKNPGLEFYEGYTDLYPHEMPEQKIIMSLEYDEFLNDRSVPRGELLDIGCGDGWFIRRAQDAGYRVAGIDFNPHRVELAKSHYGLRDVFAASLENFIQGEGKGRTFDVVTLFQVLEHLDRPNEWVAMIRSVLKPGGYVAIGVPNRDRRPDPLRGPGLDLLDIPPNHLTRWNKKGLADFLKKHGFSVERLLDVDWHPLLYALYLRNNLRLGMGVKMLKTDQVVHVSPQNRLSPNTGIVLNLIRAKEAAINLLAKMTYPAFRWGFRARGGQGVVLYGLARKES